MAQAPELVFLPLGGVGEIGMNLALYGFGQRDRRSWLAVDFGVAFAHADLPGVDLILPDIDFLEKRRASLAGIVITHAHEDHLGALIDLWPRLRVPVYATAFAANLLAAKVAGEPGAAAVPITLVTPGERVAIGPFEVEYINVAHSIPESNALAIRTALGTVVHSADWKLDDTPTVGAPTDEARLRAIGEEGVLALVCDSTNALREGRSPSEAEVGRELADIISTARRRVAFTAFASNVGRIRSIALATGAAGRNLVVVGRAMRRIIDVSQELGLLEGAPPFLGEDAYPELPPDKVVALLSGSQGEPRAALARVAVGSHPRVELAAGDIVVFSARAIPGNELDINRIVNALTARRIRVLTDRDRLVHVSGHPRRDELREIYRWLKPKIAIPVHGEAMHLAAHADLARELAVPAVLTIADGDMVRLAPDPVEQIDEIAAGRLYKDGLIVGGIDAVGVTERRRLSFAGHVGVSVVIDRRGDLLADPQVSPFGLPAGDGGGRPLMETIMDAVVDAIESLPRPRRKDAEAVREAVRRAVRAAVAGVWGKKPVCTVVVTVV